MSAPPRTYYNHNPGLFLSVTVWVVMGGVAAVLSCAAAGFALATGATLFQPAGQGLVTLAIVVVCLTTAFSLYVYSDYRAHTPDFVTIEADRLVCAYGSHRLGPAEGEQVVVPLAKVTRVVGGIFDRTWLNVSAGTWGPAASGASSPGIQVAGRRYEAKKAVLQARGYGDSPWLYSEPNALNLTWEILEDVQAALDDALERPAR